MDMAFRGCLGTRIASSVFLSRPRNVREQQAAMTKPCLQAQTALKISSLTPHECSGAVNSHTDLIHLLLLAGFVITCNHLRIETGWPHVSTKSTIIFSRLS